MQAEHPMCFSLGDTCTPHSKPGWTAGLQGSEKGEWRHWLRKWELSRTSCAAITERKDQKHLADSRMQHVRGNIWELDFPKGKESW